MKRLQKWMSGGITGSGMVANRQVRIWSHTRPAGSRLASDPPDAISAEAELWWHVELHECSPITDYGQRCQAGAWSKTETVYTGYDKDLNVALTKALKRAKEGVDR
jgi:hypothetical protein